MKKAFFAALAIGAVALLAGATTASSAQPSSMQHYMIGFGHSPTAADKSLIKSHGGTVRYSFPSINVLAVDLSPSQVNAVKQSAVRECVSRIPAYHRGPARGRPRIYLD